MVYIKCSFKSNFNTTKILLECESYIMKDSSFIEDFNYVVNTIKSTHPSSVSGLPYDFNEYASLAVIEIHDEDELIVNLCKLTALLKDSHTNIEVEYSPDDLCVNLPCVWLNDGLYAVEDRHGILKGDEIIDIGYHAINQVLEQLCTIIPHENIYLVKMRTTTYPFINYHIFSEFMLSNIKALNSKTVKVTVLRNNQTFTYELALEKYNGFLDFKSNENFIDFWVDNSTAILKLDECRYNDEYIEKLNNFFDLVRKQNIYNIIIDLRENMGGDSRVATEFLKYISIDSYYFYGVKERNQDDLININSEKCLINNNTYKNVELFKGKIICLVSNKTFSSARIFATVLKDNNIAKIVGEPTGGKPCSYGNPLRFKTPNYNIKFRVSSRIFTRPAHSCEGDIALFPNVLIYPTIEDVLNGHDVVLNEAISMFTNS